MLQQIRSICLKLSLQNTYGQLMNDLMINTKFTSLKNIVDARLAIVCKLWKPFHIGTSIPFHSFLSYAILYVG